VFSRMGSSRSGNGRVNNHHIRPAGAVVVLKAGSSTQHGAGPTADPDQSQSARCNPSPKGLVYIKWPALVKPP
jgi:hypothetical protein